MGLNRDQVVDLLLVGTIIESGARSLRKGEQMSFSLEELTIFANDVREAGRNAREELRRDPVQLLEIARATGLRGYLHGVNATDAREMLTAFVAAVDAAAPDPGETPAAKMPPKSIDHDAFWLLVARLKEASAGSEYQKASSELVKYIHDWSLASRSTSAESFVERQAYDAMAAERDRYRNALDQALPVAATEGAIKKLQEMREQVLHDQGVSVRNIDDVLTLLVAASQPEQSAREVKCFRCLCAGDVEKCDHLPSTSPAAASTAQAAGVDLNKIADYLAFVQAGMFDRNRTKWGDGYRQACSDCAEYVRSITTPSEGIAAPVEASKQPELAVWYGPMPESNGKSNFTAILLRKGDKTLGGMADGITIDRSEYPERVRYAADRVRYLIGELEKRPFILDYDADKHSGYVAATPPANASMAKASAGQGEDARKRMAEVLQFMLAYENDDEVALSEIQAAFDQQDSIKDAQEFARCYCARKMRGVLTAIQQDKQQGGADHG